MPGAGRRRSSVRATLRQPPRRRAAGLALGAARVATFALVWQLGLALTASAAPTAGAARTHSSRHLRAPPRDRAAVELPVGDAGTDPFLLGAVAKEKEEADSAGMGESMSISIMLLGSIGFQMTLFYLVNWPDVDIKYYSWQVIGDTISIFTAVLLFQAVDGCVDEYVITKFEESHYKKEIEFGIDFVHMLFWFTIMQMATAMLSGAMKCKCCPDGLIYPSQRHKEADEEHEAHAHGHGHGGHGEAHGQEAKPDGYGSTAKRRPSGTKPAKKKATPKKSAARIAAEEKHREAHHLHHELEHYREMNLACYATMLAHMTGFAAINCMNTLQHYKWFGESPLGSFTAVVASFFIICAILWGTNFIRECISAADGGDDPDEWECMWDDECEEAENDVLSLCCSFLITQAVRYCIFGMLPNDEGRLPDHVTQEAGLTALLLMFTVFIVFLLFTYIALQFNNCERKKCEELKIRAGESFSLRTSAVILCTMMMCFAWTGMWTARAWISRMRWFDMESILAQVVLALLVSAISFLAIFTLDKIADSDATGEGTDEAIMSIIMSIGLIVGFCWEKSFDKAVEEVADRAAEGGSLNPALLKMLLATGLCAIVVPAYRLYVLPKIIETKRDHQQAEKDKGFEDAAKFDGLGGMDEMTPATPELATLSSQMFELNPAEGDWKRGGTAARNEKPKKPRKPGAKSPQGRRPAPAPGKFSSGP